MAAEMKAPTPAAVALVDVGVSAAGGAKKY
jgi:hypothetical protein